MKIFNGSHSKAMGWVILVMGFVAALVLKSEAILISSFTFAAGLIANKTYQERKGTV